MYLSSIIFSKLFPATNETPAPITVPATAPTTVPAPGTKLPITAPNLAPATAPAAPVAASPVSKAILTPRLLLALFLLTPCYLSSLYSEYNSPVILDKPSM